MKKIIVATKNKGKIKEFEKMFERFDLRVQSLFDIMDLDIEETGTTFEENAILKAETISNLTNELVIADDSGLEVMALDHRPGVYSARYASDHDDEANYKKVLEEMKDITTREAQFVCAMALAIPNQPTRVVRGICKGEIGFEPIGQNGFGYDPIFYVPEYKKTMAQLSMDEKNKISHRKNAMDQLMEIMVSSDEDFSV